MVGILIYRAKQSDENLIELKTTQFDSLLDSTTETEDWFDNATISDHPTYPTGTASTSAANIIYVGIHTIDYRHPEKAFFQKSQTFGLGQINWAEIF